MKRKLLYIWYFLTMSEKPHRKEALDAARKYYGLRPIRTIDNPFPRVYEYQQRTLAFQAFQRAYINEKRHQYATAKLDKLS